MSSNRNVRHRANEGCEMRPVNASVTAKQASKILALLRRLVLLLTAIITNTLSRTVKGQAMQLKIIAVINWTLTSFETFCSSSSKEEFENLLVMFDEFEPVRLAILRQMK